MQQKQTVIKLFMVVFLFIFAPFCNESFESFYGTYEDAEKAGAIKRGWIPEIIPQTGINIYEKHNLDTNNVWIRFEASVEDIEIMFNSLEIVSNLNLKNKCYKASFRGSYPQEWWMSTTTGVDSLIIAKYDYKGDCLPDGEARSGYFFFDGKKKYAYYNN